jgi:hypothetical protein
MGKRKTKAAAERSERPEKLPKTEAALPTLPTPYQPFVLEAQHKLKEASNYVLKYL